MTIVIHRTIFQLLEIIIMNRHLHYLSRKNMFSAETFSLKLIVAKNGMSILKQKNCLIRQQVFIRKVLLWKLRIYVEVMGIPVMATYIDGFKCNLLDDKEINALKRGM